MGSECCAEKTEVTKRRTKNPEKYVYRGSNTDVFVDLISLAFILYMRVEGPKDIALLPAITSIPQLLSQIVEEKKYAFTEMIAPRGQIIKALNEKMKDMHFAAMEKYRFNHQEKQLSWLMLHGYSTRECVEELHVSVSTYRYTVRKMIEKTKSDSREDMVKKLRSDLEEC